MKKKCTNVVKDEDGTKKVCGFEYESGDAYCSDCGAPLKTNTKPPIESGMKKKKKKCTHIVTDEDGKKKVCGFEYESGDAYCSNCGAPLKTSTKPPIWLVLLIAALIVGGSIYMGVRTATNPDKVEIIAKSSDPTQGTVIGGGYYTKDTIITLTPQAVNGFRFIKWDDGDTTNPRKVKTVEKHEYVAIFKKVESPIDFYTGTYNPIGPINPKEPGNSTPPLSIQQVFDNLCIEFDRRMRDSLSFENAYPLITGDYELLIEILQMLDENPWLHAEPSSHYIESFKKRAGEEAIERINYAIFVLEIPHADSLKFTLQRNEIEKMMNSL